jgi:FkbM family methyltransferase
LPLLGVLAKGKYPNLSMIDIGANMGDTVALVRSESYFPIACIEGDGEFFEVLKTNTGSFKDVSIFKAIMGEEDREITASYKKNAGSEETARITSPLSAADRKKINITTLDTFLDKHSEWRKSKLLKIDTDGYDLKIIRGGLNYIKEVKPMIFFEYDPIFFEEQGDDTLAEFRRLKGLGYKDAVLYDNQGKLILSTDLSNELLLKQMHHYIDRNYRTPIPFYDIFLFHGEDADLAHAFVESEMKYFYEA